MLFVLNFYVALASAISRLCSDDESTPIGTFESENHIFLGKRNVSGHKSNVSFPPILPDSGALLQVKESRLPFVFLFTIKNVAIPLITFFRLLIRSRE